MAFVVATGLTQAGCDELLKILCILLPSDALIPATKYMLKKYFDNSSYGTFLRYYCPLCSGILSESLACNDCQLVHSKDELIKQKKIAFHLPLLPQRVNILQIRGEGVKLRSFTSSEQGCITDFSDGSLYCKFMDGVLLNDSDNFSLTFNTDGVPLFKSSSYNIWPLQSFINKLPPFVRKANVLLSALWFGPSKPSMNSFLKPFVDELEQLSTSGFQWIRNGTKVLSRVYAVACCCDSVARAMVQNIKQFNGLYGCTWCISAGERLEKGRGTVRAYTDVENLTLRADADMRKWLRKPICKVSP